MHRLNAESLARFSSGYGQQVDNELVDHIISIEGFLREVLHQRDCTPIFALWAARVLQDKFRYAGALEQANLCMTLEQRIMQLWSNPSAHTQALELLNMASHLRLGLTRGSTGSREFMRLPRMVQPVLCEAEAG